MSDPRAQAAAPLAEIVGRYAPALRRKIAERLVRPRARLTAEQLTESIVAANNNVPLLDRRLRDLPHLPRKLLAVAACARRTRWRLGHLLEVCLALDSPDPLACIFDLFEAGLLYPEIPGSSPQIASFEAWLGSAIASSHDVFVPPLVRQRALLAGLSLDSPPGELPSRPQDEVHRADGLDLPLRLAVLWQMARQSPFRLTQQGALFKRDQERLRDDPLLNAAAVDELVALPARGPVLAELALALGLLRAKDTDWVAAEVPYPLLADAAEVSVQLWSALNSLERWPVGRQPDACQPAPWHPSTAVLALAALAGTPQDHWTAVNDLVLWLWQRHPFWKPRETPEDAEGQEEARSAPPHTLQHWAEQFLLGWAYALQLLEASRDGPERWLVRLTPWGRGVLGLAPMPEPPAFPKTLLVQPNLEIIAYRQGLTPQLVGQLSRVCTWKGLGSACTLHLQPESVYQGLETGLSQEEILRLLQQHAVRELPAAVVQALRTWAQKRERIAVYAAAVLLEFACPEDLQEALSRGLNAIVLNEHLALVENESCLDYRQFRLIGARDYTLPPDRCVSVGTDGVSLSVDVARADLLLETELRRFADPGAGPSADGRRLYLLTPASLTKARADGLSTRHLEEWFARRTGQSLPPAVRLLLEGPSLPPSRLARLLVLQMPDPAAAEGLMQWPASRQLIRERIGPTALAVEPADLPGLLRLLAELGIAVEGVEAMGLPARGDTSLPDPADRPLSGD